MVVFSRVTDARGRNNEALSVVCASVPNSVSYNLFRLFAISNTYYIKKGYIAAYYSWIA